MEGTLDQQQQDHLQIKPEDRFRADAHTKDLNHENPPLVPPAPIIEKPKE